MDGIGLNNMPAGSVGKKEHSRASNQHGLLAVPVQPTKRNSAIWRRSFEPQQMGERSSSQVQKQRSASQRSRKSSGKTQMYKEICTAVNQYNKRYKGSRFPVSLPSKVSHKLAILE